MINVQMCKFKMCRFSVSKAFNFKIKKIIKLLRK